MHVYEVTTDIAADAPTVWQHWSAVTRWPAWTPTVKAVQAHGAEALTVGARFTVEQPRLRPATWEVTQLEAPRAFSWESRTPGLRVVADHAVTPRADGGVTAVLRVSFVGVLAPVAAFFGGKLTAQYLAQEGAALKRVAEAGGIRPG